MKKFGRNILITGHRCQQCGHEWKPYKKSWKSLPVKCPKCGSRKWKQKNHKL